jgi:hypothetical protein
MHTEEDKDPFARPSSLSICSLLPSRATLDMKFTIWMTTMAVVAAVIYLDQIQGQLTYSACKALCIL